MMQMNAEGEEVRTPPFLYQVSDYIDGRDESQPRLTVFQSQRETPLKEIESVPPPFPLPRLKVLTLSEAAGFRLTNPSLGPKNSRLQGFFTSILWKNAPNAGPTSMTMVISSLQPAHTHTA